MRQIINNLANSLLYQAYKTMDFLFYGRYSDFPLGKLPRAGVEKYMEIWENARSREYPIVDEYEGRLGKAIDQDWLHSLALITQVVIKDSEVCYQHGRLLYTILSHYLDENKLDNVNIIETGTARGFSSLCMAKAIRDNNSHGKIVTIDLLPNEIRFYWNCLVDSRGPATRSELLGGYRNLLDDYIFYIQGDSILQLKKISISRVHFAFLDGAHTYKAVLREFEIISKKQESGDIVFFDDYTLATFPDVVKAVNFICSEYGYNKEVILLNEGRGYVYATKI